MGLRPVTGLLRTQRVSVVNRENPEDEREEASHSTEPADTAAPRGMSDELVEGETLDVGDDPKSEEKKK